MLDHPPDVPELDRRALWTRLAIVGVILAAVAAAFAWAAGWLTPQRVTPATFIDEFQKIDGVHPGFRRNHSKGICFTGFFDGNSAATKYSKAVVFTEQHVPTIGRFALAGGQPYQADAARTVRSMAARLLPAGGEEWRIGVNNVPMFAVSTPQAFYEQIVASAPDPATGKPDPQKMKAFLAAHPESARAIAAIQARSASSGFGDETYNGINAFRLVDASGRSTAVRWSTVPVQAAQPEDPARAAQNDKNYLFDALIADVAQHPLQWRLVATIAKPGDPTSDPSQAWPDDREHVELGMLTVERVESEDTGACRDINFDPLVLPDGIVGSDDPLLSTRSAVYSASFRGRAGESKPPSAVQVPERPGEAKP